MNALLLVLGGAALIMCAARCTIRVHREQEALLVDLRAAERAAMLGWLTHCYLPAALVALDGSPRPEEPMAPPSSPLDVRVDPPDLRAGTAERSLGRRRHDEPVAV